MITIPTPINSCEQHRPWIRRYIRDVNWPVTRVSPIGIYALPQFQVKPQDRLERTFYEVGCGAVLPGTETAAKWRSSRSAYRTAPGSMLDTADIVRDRDLSTTGGWPDRDYFKRLNLSKVPSKVAVHAGTRHTTANFHVQSFRPNLFPACIQIVV